jgi:hypothetical protein
MANYLKATDFASKDALLSGDPNKIVKGTEINDEFDSIQTAVNSKANKNNAALTGTPTAPTAAMATSTTQIATTAFVQAAISAAYPVGSVYISTIATNPATTFGFGTWVEFGAGKVLVGQDTGDTAFDVLEETGGSKDAIVVEHTHTVSGGAHQHYTVVNGTVPESGDVTASNSVSEKATQAGSSYQSYVMRPGAGTADVGLTSSTAHTHDVSSSGSSATNTNLQPYVVVKMWKRTA